MKTENLPAADETSVILRTEEDLVAARLPDLRVKISDLIRNGARNVTINLTETQMVDSAGMGLLISTHNSLKALGGRLSVSNVSQDVLELLTAMRLHQHFDISAQK